MYFFTDNYVYEYGVDAVGEDTREGYYERLIKDGDKNTYWESTRNNPKLYISLAGNRDIDCLWIKADNISTFTLYYYANNSWTQVNKTPQKKDGNVYFLFEFTEASAKDWRIDFVNSSSSNVKVYEVFLMKKRLFQETDDALPSKVDIMYRDIASVEHTLSDGRAVIYSGRKPYAEIAIEYQYTSKTNRDNLFNIYAYPKLRAPFCILPDLDYPEGIFRVVWIDKVFPLIYASSYKGAGFTGVIRLQEC